MKSPYRTIGLVGGGQLARMSAQAAQRLGFRVVILDSDPDCPAAQVTPLRVDGRCDDPAALRTLARQCDVVTLEHEWISPSYFAQIEETGRDVYPSSSTLAFLVDKLVQRRQLHAHGLTGPLARPLSSLADARLLAGEWGYPLVLKTRHGGYDGQGVHVVRSESELTDAFPTDPSEWYAEQFVAFDRELATIVARGIDGQTAIHPVVESVQTRDGRRCDTVTAPAPALTSVTQLAARQAAIGAVEAVSGIGLFGVELFQLKDGSIMVNEVAPRPHNSGHYTMDCCATSQFEQHIRAVTGLALGPTDLIGGGAAMTNLLAASTDPFDVPAGIRRALASVPGAHIHWYGKTAQRPGRQMGHINVLAETPEKALARALRARTAFWNAG